MVEHMFVFQAWTLVCGWRTGRPSGVDTCPCSSYKLQLHLGAVRQGATNVYELRPLGLHNKFTNLSILHKNFKNFLFFLVILRIDFFENL